MEEEATLIETLVDKAEAYTNSSIDLLRLKAIDKSANAMSSIVSTVIIAVSVIIVISMVNIGAALWIGELIGNAFYGFFIVAAFYLLVAIILVAFRESLLKTALSNSIISHIRKEKHI